VNQNAFSLSGETKHRNSMAELSLAQLIIRPCLTDPSTEPPGGSAVLCSLQQLGKVR